MELAVALIVLAVGLMLEHGRKIPLADPHSPRRHR